jgi:hypothetical protein
MSKLLAWIEKKAIPFVAKWWKPIAVVVGLILVVIVGKIIIRGILGIFGGGNAEPPPADGIVSAADAEKAKIAQTVTGATDQQVADDFNKAVKG